MEEVFKLVDQQYKALVKVLTSEEDESLPLDHKRLGRAIGIVGNVVFLLVWLIIFFVFLAKVLDFFSIKLTWKTLQPFGGAAFKVLFIIIALIITLLLFCGKWLLIVKRLFENFKIVTIIGLTNLFVAAIQMAKNYKDDNRFTSLMIDFVLDVFALSDLK